MTNEPTYSIVYVTEAESDETARMPAQEAEQRWSELTAAPDTLEAFLHKHDADGTRCVRDYERAP